ncbi:hypothetical protein B0H10DRAFT_1957316 [Mycena sp. CBHHK59/15]|nr:hypothetical protein B0H10DRAFT_1957316 [Mycena sp. CBHHK59/15]
MSPVEHPEDRVEPAEVFMPTYWRHLSQSEISYFLPSRAHGLNDLFHQWESVTTMRLRLTLLACKIEMSPGCCDDTRFTYTPPSSPEIALDQAEETLSIYDDKPALELHQECLDGPRKLSTDRLSHLEIARRHVSSGLDEYERSLTPSWVAPPLLVDFPEPLAQLLEVEWKMQLSGTRTDEVIVPPTVARFPLPPSKFQEAACKVDHQNLQRRSVAKHWQAHNNVKFSIEQMATILPKCKWQRTTIQNAVFALYTFAWIRIEEDDVHCSQSRTLSGRHIAAVIVHVPGAQIMSVKGGSRVKAFARQDDEADGTLPPSETKFGVPAVDQSMTGQLLHRFKRSFCVVSLMPMDPNIRGRAWTCSGMNMIKANDELWKFSTRPSTRESARTIHARRDMSHI